LQRMLEYLAKDGSLEPLFLGKMAAEHIPLVRELQFRKVLHKPPLRPRYMDDPDALQRLERLRQGASVLDLLKESNS
ncbi:MAG: tyrosine/phenylalanine carboxypeptidase domain-containing protein, partial [Pirellulales bacterium]